MMKKIILAFLTIGMMVLGTNEMSAQVTETATATATAEIVTPITIQNVADMNFDQLAVVNGGSGTVVMATDGSLTPSTGITAVVNTSGTPATFTVSGVAGYAYTLSNNNSGSITLHNADDSQSMTVNAFTIDTAGGVWSDGVLTGGSQTVKIGGTLNIGAAAAAVPGTYTTKSGNELSITVVYN